MNTHVGAEAVPNLPPDALLMQMASGAMLTQALRVVAELGVADVIGDGAKECDEIAGAVGADPRSLYRVMRSLAAVGVFSESSKRTFENTAMSSLLRTDDPGSMRNTIVFMGAPWHFNVWSEMRHSVETGKSAWSKYHGVEVWNWLQNHPAEAENFNRTMTELSYMAAPPIVQAYDFSGVHTIVDLAGGHGYLLSQILKANPSLRGILFDTPSVISGAGKFFEEAGVDDRVEKVSGDFFQSVPAADAYLMKHIIHDWDDEKSVAIMRNINAAMTGDGRLLLAEMVVPEGNEPHYSKVLDLEMLTSPGGIERTAEEYSALFEAAGFRLNRIVPTRSPFSVIEGVKA